MELPPPGNRRVSISNPQETPHKSSTAHGIMPARSSMASSTSSTKPHSSADDHKSSISSSVPGGSNPQKSSLLPPDVPLQQRRGSTASSVRYADEQVKSLASDKDKDKEKKDKSKGKSKNKGEGLLNMLRKTLQGSQSEEMVVTSETPALVPFGDVVGCLAVHVKSCRQFSHRFIVQQHVNVFIRISINHVTKCTKLRNLKAANNEKNFILRFDEVKYFSVQVPRRQDDERNNIYLELMQDGGSPERPALSLGSVDAHLYEIIQKGCFTEVLEMKHRNSFICRVEVEFMFSYGNFGYGFSHQLKPLQKIIEPSMFMKIAPPPERTDPITNVITPQRVEYPAFLSPELNVSIGAAEPNHPKAVRLEKLQEKPRERLEKMKEEYKNLNTWMEKSDYLRNLITPKVASKVSEEPSLNELSEENSSVLDEMYGTIRHGFHPRKPEHISHEFVDKGDKEGRVIPVVKLVEQDFSEHALPESGESSSTDVPLPPIHTLQIIEEDETPREQAAPEWEDVPYEERKNVVFPPDENLMPKCPSILRITPSLQEVKHKKEKVPHFSDDLVVSDRPLGQENTNQKGKLPTQLRQTWERHPTDLNTSLRKVAFVQKEYTTPVFRADSRDFTPKYQKLIKSGFDPFLRNIHSKMPFRRKKDSHRSPSILSSDDAEHEDQDPSYPEHSRSAGSHTPWPEDPNLATIHMVNKKSNLPPEHTTTATMTKGRKNTWSHDPTLNTTGTSDMKNLFTSDHPVYTITKLSDTDYKLSTDPSSVTARPSDTRLSSAPSSSTARPSDTRLSSAPSSSTARPSDTRLSSAPSSSTARPSDTRLSSVHSSNTAKPSDTLLSSAHSSNTTKPSDMRLSSAPSSNTAKPSDTRLSSGPGSSNTAKPSDTRLSSVHSSSTAKPSDTRLSSVHSSNTAKPSDTRLSSVHSSSTAKPSDTRLSSVHSSNTAKPSDMRLSSGPGSYTEKPSDTRLSSAHSFNTAKPSDTRLSSVHSSSTARPSDTRLSSGPGSYTEKPSDTRLSSVHSSNTTRPSDTRLSSVHSSSTARPSDTRLSSVHSSNTAKPSDTRLSSVHSSNTAKPSDTRLSSVHSSSTARPSDTRLSSVHSSNTAKPSDTRLSSVHSSNTAKPSDTRLSSGPGSYTAKPSDTRLSSVHSSSTAKPSETMLSTGPGSNTAKPSDTRLSSVHSSSTARPSDTRLSSVHSSSTARPSDTRLSSVHSSNTAKPSDTRLSSGPGSYTAKPSDTRLSSVHSSSTAKPSETMLSTGPGSNTAKPSDTRLSSVHSSSTARPSDTRLSSVHSSSTARPSDTRLSSVHSSSTARPSDTRLSSVHSSSTAKPSDTRLSSIHSSNMAKPSETMLSTGPGSNTAKPSDTRLSSVHSSDTEKPSDTRPSSVPSSNMAKPSDTRISSAPSSNSSQPSGLNRLSHNPSIISTKSSDLKNKLSRDPSTILTKLSDVSISSHDSINNAKKSSDTSTLSRVLSIISAKSLDTRTSSRVLSIISAKSSDGKNKLPGSNPTVHSDLTTNAARTPASRDKLVRDPAVFTVDSLDMQLPNVPFPNYQKESSTPENVNIYHPSSSIKLTSDAGNRRSSIALKSIFSRNLQDLSDELFPNADMGTNAEAIQGSSSRPLSVHDRPSGGAEDKVFEKVQDIKSWLSSKDILNSQAFLSPVVKSVPQDVFPEGGPGASSDIENVSGKPLEAAEVNFPTSRKSSFKTKHLASEVSSSNLGLNGGVYDYIIKQIFTAPLLSHLEPGAGPGAGPSEAQPAPQEQPRASWERRASSSQIANYEEDNNEVPLSPAKSSISRILQSFPVETLLESGMISVTELEKENQSSLMDAQTASPEEKVLNLTEHCNVESQTTLLSRRTTPTTNPTDTFVRRADDNEDSQRADTKSDFPTEYQHLDTEEAGLSSTLEILSSSFVGKLKDIDAVMLKSFLKNIFKAFFKYNQSERELERLMPHSSPGSAEYLEKIQGNLIKADKVDRKATLDPKLCGLLETVSESEVNNLKVELGKHIQHCLIERLSEVGHITKENLPKVYQNLCQMSEKAEAREPSPPQDKYSETIRESMPFVDSFNHHFVDKHLETKLRSFLNEALQKYFLKNLSGSNLFNETDSMALRPSMSSLRSRTSLRCLPELEEDIASGGLGSKLEINMKYPLSESLQNCLDLLPESELLGLKTDLNKYVQVLFIEKLQKSGLITERQLEGISQRVNSLDSSSRPLKFTKPDLPLRDEREDSEKQKKFPKVFPNPTLPTFLEDLYREKVLIRKEEKGGFFPHSLKENPPTVWEHKQVYSREVKTLIKVQPHPHKNTQSDPLNQSPERLADIFLKKHQKDHGFMQLPQAENPVCKTETQGSYSWDGRSKPIPSKLCFEKTLRAKSLDKRESNNICKLLAQERPDTGLPPYLKLPTAKMSRENEHLNRLPFPTWRNSAFLYVNTESGEQSKLDKYCQKWKGNNNNNKRHWVTFAQFKNEPDTLYTNPYEACHEKCTKISESQPFEHREDGRSSRPFFFPEVLKRENVTSRRKERDYTTKPKKSFYKLVRILPATLPTRPHLRKSVPRALLHWTARRTIHDCLDRFDDLHMPSVKHPKILKSRARLLGKSPDDPHNQAKHCARPYTAPEQNKRRESVAGKFASTQMDSAGLVHIHDTTPEYEIRKLRSKRKLKENIEKRPLICDIIQMLGTIG